MRLAILMEDPFANAVTMGKLVETVIYKHIRSFYAPLGSKVGYFRGGDKNKEIDIVVEKPDKAKILIEAKYREQAKLPLTDALSAYAGDAQAAFIITKRAEDFGIQESVSGNPIYRIPSFVFLYLVGHCEKNGLSDI
jgi:predicted AAA+ superfamily ATPase